MPEKNSTPDNYLSTAETAKLLGLSIGTVQNMVEKGELSAWKTTGGHRRIYRSSVERLLHQQDTNDATHAATMSSVRDCSRKSSGAFRLLVVEDSAVTLKLYEKLLSDIKQPLETTYVTDGIKALLELGDNAYDMLILDLEIPFVNGYQMLENIKRNERLQGLHVLIITSTDEVEVRSHDVVNDDIEVLTKPFDKAFLSGYLTGVVMARKFAS